MDNYSIVIPQESQYEAVLEFLFEDFVQRERLCVTSGLASEIKEKEYDANDAAELFGIMQKRLSLIAIDKRDNLVAGICINISVEDLDNIPQEEITSKRQVIHKFTTNLEEGNRPSEVNNTAPIGLQLWMLGVKEIHSGKGLARALAEKTVELAQQREFNYVESIATCPATRYLFKSMGFEAKSNMKFQDFVIEDNKPGFPYATSEDWAEFTVKIL